MPLLSDVVAVPEAIDVVLQRATAPHPDDRFASIAEFAQAWHLALTGAPAAIRTTGGLTGGLEARTISSTVVSMPAVGANPYKGLRAFREADAADYCGRDELVGRLVAAVEAEPFVAVVGPSGSGKSSLVHAGVVPEFRRRGALVVSMVPGTAPMSELEAALRRVATVEDESAIAERLQAPGGLVAVAADLAEGEQLVLVIDQFEELWTLVDSHAERDRFAELLEHAATADQATLRVVVTLRADLYDRPLQHPGLGRVVSDATFAVTPMSASELQDAIVGPAERAAVRFEPGLVATMIGEVISRPGALPLLQFTLTELYDRRDNATVTTKAYEELGGIGGALARRAEDLYAEMDPARQAGVRSLFTQLVTPGDDNDDLRRRATTEELTGVPPDVIEQYRANRLLVTDHHPITREPTVEVAHEALLREWPRLREWIDADRDTIRLRRLITQTAGDWEAAGRDDSVLYRGPRLAAAADVARRMPLAQSEREFLAASHELADHERVEAEQRAALQARQNRRLRRTLTATAIVLVLALVFGAFAVTQRAKANDNAARAADNAARAEANAATARQQLLITQSQSILPTDRQLAALLAVEADRQAPNADTRDAMLNVVMAEPRIQQTFSSATGVLAPISDHRVVVSPDPTRLDVYDWRTGRSVPWPATSPLPTKIQWGAASLDTTVLGVLDADGQLWTYSGRTLAPIGKTPLATGIRDGAFKLGFDGRTLAVWGAAHPETPGRVEYAVYTRAGDTWVRAPAPAGVRVTPGRVDVSADGSVIAAVASQPTAEGTERSDLTVNDVATGALLHAFTVPSAYDIVLDWARRRVVVSRRIGGAPGDISWYDLDEAAPVEHVVDQGLSPVGSADLAYDATYTRLGVNGNAGFQAFDAATMAPPPGIAVVHTGTQQGPIRFLDPNQVLLATVGAGPVSRWDLTGTASLASPDADEFDFGVGPTGDPDRLLGFSTLGPDTAVTVLDADRRPLGPRLPVTPDVASLPAAVQRVARKLNPAACVDRGSGRIATIALGTGDVVIRSGTAPFRELSRAPGVAAALGTPAGCTWRPDGRQIAIGNYPQAELAGVTSVALYDVESKQLRSTHAVPNLLVALSLVYRDDSEVLWVSGPSGGTPDVVELTDLDGRPRLRTRFPGAAAIAVDADGRLVVLAGNMLRRYDAQTFRPFGPPLEVRSTIAYYISPAPAGGEVVLTSTAGWRLVDLDAGRTLGPEMPGPTLAAFSGSDSNVSAFAGSGAARAQWDLAPARVREAACSLAGRNLTEEEWSRYLPTAGALQRTCPQYPQG
ncbi:MAG TPA: ATP-binding protein [Acidimicrobiia bacterium]|nr:ATP-binding protein [Acidimicrobiia bacterium]